MTAIAPSQFYSENVGLIHKISKRGYARLQAAGVSMDYEDVFQEMAIVFLRAYEKFDAARGFKFSTYFYMAAFNRLNKWAQDLIDERINQGVVSIQELDTHGDEETNLAEVLMVDESTPEGHMRVTEFLEHIGKTLSPLANLILTWVVSPPQELLEEIRRAEAYALYGRQRGYQCRCMANVSPRYVANFVRMISNATQGECDRALKEIERLRYSDARQYLGA